jgi:hypothetical protein
MSASSPLGAAGGTSSQFESLKEKKAAKQQWLRVLQDALDADSWGQSIEAVEEYEKLYRKLEQSINELHLTADEKGQCLKIAHSVQLRMNTLQGQEAAINDQAGSAKQVASQKLSLDEVRGLVPVMQGLFDKSSSGAAFPIELKNYTATLEKKEQSGGEVFIAHDDRLEKEERGSLLLPPKAKSGQTTITIHIDKIGLKDAQTYINAFITVSVADLNGQIMESQDTPKSNSLKPNYVLFGHTVHVQLPLEEIQARGLCLFFEFKHYKPQKKKISTRCYALMEAKEIVLAKERDVTCLELYKKPTDFSRRNLSLFTIKQLYLHCTVTFTKH